MPTTVEIVVEAPEDIGERVDVVLGRRAPGVSRRVARSLALAGAVRRDGAIVRPSQRVAHGDRLVLAVDTAAAPPELAVLHVTDGFVYVDKPAGVHTLRLRPDDPASLADAVAARHPECASASGAARDGGAIHRLDRETTGVVAFARSPAAWVAGRAAIAHASTLKLYLALCHLDDARPWPPMRAGVTAAPVPAALAELAVPLGACAEPPVPSALASIHVDLPLGHGATRRHVAVRPDGQPAHSQITALARGEHHCLVAVHLRHGHRHQVRVHLAALGMPIVGDARYGGDAGALRLHAAALQLWRERQPEPRVLAPLHDAFAQRLRQLSLRATHGRP